MNKHDIRKIEEALGLTLFAEPPMRVTLNGKTTHWSGFRATRRGEAPVLLSTKEVDRLAKSQNPTRTWASIAKQRCRKKAAR